MQDICTYHVEVQDEVDEAALNAAGPSRLFWPLPLWSSVWKWQFLAISPASLKRKRYRIQRCFSYWLRPSFMSFLSSPELATNSGA